MPGTIIHREQMPDGTLKIWERQDDGQVTQTIVGTPRNRSQEMRDSMNPYWEMMQDPRYRQFVLDPQDRATQRQWEDLQRQRALQDRTATQQDRRVDIDSRSTDAKITNDRELVRLRAEELKQQEAQHSRSAALSASLELAKMRGPGNAAQFIDAGRRLRGFGIESGALAQIAGGGSPIGSFGTSFQMQPQSMRDRMSGMMGTPPAGGGGGQGGVPPPGSAPVSTIPTQAQIDQRHANDKALAVRIMSRPGQLQRGSIEQLSPYERAYLGSYGEEAGFDDESFQEAYRRAGIHQGAGRLRG